MLLLVFRRLCVSDCTTSTSFAFLNVVKLAKVGHGGPVFCLAPLLANDEAIGLVTGSYDATIKALPPHCENQNLETPRR